MSNGKIRPRVSIIAIAVFVIFTILLLIAYFLSRNWQILLWGVPTLILLLVNVALLFLGTFMDMAPMIIICTPIFLPVVKAFGVDPIHFGVILILNAGIGLNTPPVGSVQFVACAIGRISIGESMRTIWPFYGASVAVLLLVTYVPGLSLWLPRLFH